jgi:cyclopropane fatty-acyl-phospholipid synthase-like methyltransferase
MKLSKVIKRSIFRGILPHRLLKAITFQKDRKKGARTDKDAQLNLYSEILKNDFLHYGYFKDPDTDPAEISINDIERAQLDYAKLVVDNVTDKNKAVLDIGCGMGGLSHLLKENGFSPYALTPDINQIHYIQQKYPDIPLIKGRFRDIDVEKYSHFFGTLINSESFQYIKLSRAFEIVDQILVPDGKWIICDYFKKGKSFEKSGKKWEDFLERLEEHRWEITYQQDITENVAVTLKYLYMLGTRIGVPLAEFILEKIKVKMPGLYYLTEDVWEKLDEEKVDAIEVINPKRFCDEKRYMLLVLNRVIGR